MLVMFTIVFQVEPSKPSTSNVPLVLSPFIQKLNCVATPGYVAVVILFPVPVNFRDGGAVLYISVVSLRPLLNIHPGGGVRPLSNPSVTEPEVVVVNGDVLTSSL